MEHEVNGLDYRYVYSDKARLSVVVQGIENGSASLLDSRGELHAYYHCDYLGTTDYLTSAVNSKVISWTSYNEWGEITHNAVLKCGQRELDLVKEYATHDYDAVLNMYYAKARFYDVDNRRFTAVDPILDPRQYDLSQYATDPMQLVQYLYVKDNAVNWIDPLGKFLTGTILQLRARGEDVLLVNQYLFEHGYLTELYYSDRFDEYTIDTVNAVKALQKDWKLAQTGTVNRTLWEKMGYSLNDTLAEEFWSGTKGNDTISITIIGSNITIKYSPKIYIGEQVTKSTMVYRQGSYYPVFYQCEEPVDEETYNAYLDRAVAGLKMWGLGSITIQGVDGTVSVEIAPIKVDSKSQADIKLNISKEGRGITWGAFVWNPGLAQGFTIPLGNSVYSENLKNNVDAVSNIVAHEFGHVLGLGDAYAEWYTPEAPKNIVHPNGIMRSPYRQQPVFTENDIEMILYAWETGGLQGYTDGFIAELSQAYFH